MKNKIIMLGMFCVFSISISAQTFELPLECKKILDKNFVGWKSAEVSNDVSIYYLNEKFTDAPDLIKGDWNGDGNEDYAVLIRHGVEKIQGKIVSRVFTIVFIKQATGYNYFRLDGGDYIQTTKKGEKGYDHEKRKDFTFQNDSILVCIYEKTGISFIWNKKSFKRIVTSD